MNATFLSTLAFYISKFYPEEMDPTLKPKDSSGCKPCRNEKYDFIIVGAGSAGCVLANRLSENPNWKILLIEAGGDEDYVTDVPALAGSFTGTKYDWNYTTVKQKNVCQDTQGNCHFPLGHVMGGTSTIGEMLYSRGNRRDYDEWLSLGNPGWGYKDVLPYFLKSENMTIPELMHSPYHSTKGPLPIAHAHYESPISQKYIDEGKKFGIHEADYNGEWQTGIGFKQLTLKDAVRCSSSKAFINPIKNRQNLFIFKNTVVSKILIGGKGDKRATGVTCITNGEEYNVYSSKEVILSAGAINTPKLLMLSGVGPRKHLEQLRIPIHSDLPVGQYLVDPPSVLIDFRLKSEEIVHNREHKEEAIIQYAQDKKGLLSAPQKLAMGFLDSNAPKQTPDLLPDMLSQSGYDIDFIGDSKESIFSNIETPLKPLSTGTVKLKSSNYMDPPLIDPNYFHKNNEKETIQRAVNIVTTYFKVTNWTYESPKLIVHPNCNYDGTVTEEFITCYIKYHTRTGLHPTSTARMGPQTDKAAVVDSMLKVHRVKKLRIADASVIPKPLRAIPYATVVMIAEKAADFIKSDYK